MREKSLTWKIVKDLSFILGIPALVIGAMVIMMPIHDSDLQRDAKHELLGAVGRMQSVPNVDDAYALLSACESGTSAEIICRWADYDVTYRGHRLKASTIAVDYYNMHNRYDREHDRHFPYMTALVRINRRPQITLASYQF